MRWVFVLLLLAACGPDDGDVITPCRECGPGAILNGRFLRANSGLAANRRGDLARAVAGQLQWLASDFTVRDTQTFEAAPSSYDPEVDGVALADDGSALVTIKSDDDFEYVTSILSLGVDGTPRWRIEPGDLTDWSHYAVVADGDVAVVTGQRFAIDYDTPLTTGDVVALDGPTGEVRWRRRFPQPDVDQQQVALALVPDGPVIVAGSFNNTLDLGGSVGTLTAVGSFDVFVAGLDRATGDALWATQFSVDRFVLASAKHLAVSPTGDVAMIVGWQTTIDHDSGIAAGSLAIAGQTVAPSDLSRALALLGPAGELQWIQSSEDFISLVTDGTQVFASARGVFAGLSATGVDWRRSLDGLGYHFGFVSAFVGDRLLGTIASVPDQDGLGPLVDGDVEISGEGTAFVELAH